MLKINYKINERGVALPAMLFLLLVAAVVTLIVSSKVKDQQSYQSKAQVVSQNAAYLAPPSQTVTVNAVFTVTVKINTVDAVNAVQTYVKYPTDSLTLVSIDTSQSAFDIQAQQQDNNGIISLARGTLTPVSGDNVVAILTFQAKNTAGQATISFETGTVALHAVTNANVLTTFEGGTYTIVLPPPSPSATPVVDTIPPQVTITNPVNGSTVIRRSTVTLEAQASDNIAVQSVVFSVNSAVLCTDTTAPYACSWKVPGKKGGKYTIAARATDTANNASTATSSITGN